MSKKMKLWKEKLKKADNFREDLLNIKEQLAIWNPKSGIQLKKHNN